MSLPRAQFLPPKPRPMVLPQSSRQRREKEVLQPSTLSKWVDALFISGIVIGVLALVIAAMVLIGSFGK